MVAGSVGALLLGATAGTAEAQQKTFKLDRLEMPGAPEDGLTLFRPVTNQRTIFYGQLGIGYQLRPLRTSTVTTDQATINRSSSTVVQDQLAVYGNAGFQLFDRATIGLSFPWWPVQTGENPIYTAGGGLPSPGVTRTTNVVTGGPAAGDLRLDLRGVLVRSEDRKSALGAQLNVFFPTGTPSNFGGDDKASVLAMVTAETQVKFLILTANTGLHFRPRHSINDPNVGNGLGVGNEWRWAVGAFIPFKDGKYRLGGSIFGQTGFESDNVIGKTAFTKRNTPVEFNIEGRMRFGPADHWYLGAGAGSSILRGYGAPDLRLLGVFGLYIPILDTDPKSPDRKAETKKWRQEHVGDRDGDGIPDDIDACPDEPEDHLGNDPNDGCPMPKDRDGDGIPDQYDKCPDEPEDKDGIDDGDGCPEDDVDNDGVPDVTDACPRVPGKPNKDPKRNGCPTTIDVDESGNIRVLQKVEFEFGTAKLSPASFPILQEVADYLKATPGIKKMAVEGHTDNKGSAALNKRLSQERAAACMNWLTSHGIAADRLEANGYGMEKPLVDNDTAENRAKNRRVEFNIVKQDSK
ncbi:MAG: OmpA family protein [Labilithrix sp.]|nr:OmpA family protein [Labilithrix sp.]MCW5818129.1 OmpA family protein [Labilithrix sp.]